MSLVLAQLAVRRAQTTPLVAVLVGFLVVAVYLMRPEVIEGFFQWMLNSVFDALHQSTGTDVEAPTPTDSPDPNTLTPPKETR